MRTEVKRAFTELVALAVQFCLSAAEKLSASEVDAAGRIGLAWAIAQQATLDLEERLRATPEGRAIWNQYQSRGLPGRN